MLRKFLRSKIHRATVTQADLHYEGSLTLPPDLLEAASIMPYESVHVWNVTRGTRLETYAILGEPGSSDVCINGAAAHLVSPGDIVIIATFGFLQDSDPNQLNVPEPTVVFVDENNKITFLDKEIPGPLVRDSNQRGEGSKGATVATTLDSSESTNSEKSPSESPCTKPICSASHRDDC